MWFWFFLFWFLCGFGARGVVVGGLVGCVGGLCCGVWCCRGFCVFCGVFWLFFVFVFFVVFVVGVMVVLGEGFCGEGLLWCVKGL